MEVVRVFNNELSSLYEVKPPISKAKMTQITKSAIKGIKFYKHIVQSVEKFIQKCRPEYKVPGLYVVDSIVRQSRHQFGADKDVFGPRFVKNITTTFQHLFKCPEDDRPKIIRVLNLWQKNAVFPIEVIQPLLDMGHPNSSNEWPLDASDNTKESPANRSKDDHCHKSSDSWKGWPQGNEEVSHNKSYAEMSTKNLEKFNRTEMSNALMDEETSRSSHHRNQLEMAQEEVVKFDKKLLDFDYGDEEDEEETKNEESHLSTQPNALALSVAQEMLSNPELLKQLQQMAAASTIPNAEPLKDNQPLPSKIDNTDSTFSQDMQRSPPHSMVPPPVYQQPLMQHNVHLVKGESDTDERVIPDSSVSTKDLDERSLAAVMATHDMLSLGHPAFPQDEMVPKPDKDDRVSTQDLDERSLASLIAPPAAVANIVYPETPSMMQFQYDKNGIPYPASAAIPGMEPLNMDAGYPPVLPPDPHIIQNSQGDNDERVLFNVSVPREPPLPPHDFDERQLMPIEERSRRDRSRSRSRGRSGRRRSRSRSPRRKRSRSRSHSRKNRSRSRERERERERIREKERERERERERRRKGIPPIKKGCVSVCSTTLWLGHVPKSCSEVDITETFSQYGTILSIDMIPPRGCAYVVMDRRQDGYKALQKLKNVKLQGSNIKMAWAPGKGVKGKEYKEYWTVDLGVSYVPYDKIPESAEALDALEEGGFIDEESLPEHLLALRKQPNEAKFNSNKSTGPENKTFSEIQSVPNMVPPPIMPPTSVGLPMVLPHLMQPQFGLHLPGILPPQAMVMQVPMGIPPPTPMLMVQQQSQGLLSGQPLPMVGGLPQIPPRAVAPVTPVTTLANIKSSSEPVKSSSAAPSTSVGDATPTEEEGTTLPSSSVPISTAVSTQSGVSLAQFNHLLGINSTRPMLSVPPPVSTSGDSSSNPIPYPPPSMGFNFPPPGIRAPGQGVLPNPQFPWMQKQMGSPFTDADTTRTSTSSVRPVPPPQPGMPMHMFGNRPPFHNNPSSASSMKDMQRDGVQNDRNVMDMDNRCPSPNQHEKMVISTDDESSMDIEYPRNDVPPGPRFPGMHEFPRGGPMNMPRMRGPLLPGNRFPRGMHMGSSYPMRMGGPRGMGGSNMHNRMEFSPQGPHGSRMPGHHGSQRNDGMHHHEDRDWYPRDFEGPAREFDGPPREFEGPPYERDRERRFHDDWNRDSWVTPNDIHDSRRNPRERGERHDDHGERRDDHGARRDDHSERHDDHSEKHDDHWNRNDSRPPKDSSSGDRQDTPNKPKEKSSSKSKASIASDFLKLRSYQQSRKRGFSNDQTRTEKPKDNGEKKTGDEKSLNNEPAPSPLSLPSKDKGLESGNNSSKRERDREARKRSRWGRTLSEEREFQEQRRNEIEMKFQSYEQEHAAQQPPPSSSTEAQESETKLENTEESSQNKIEEPVPNINETNIKIEPENVPIVHNSGETVENNFEETKQNFSMQNENSVPSETVVDNSGFEPSKDSVNVSLPETADASVSEPETICTSKVAENNVTAESLSDNAVFGDNSNDLGANSNVDNSNELTNNASMLSSQS